MISPTQHRLHRRCPRAWWYQYVGGRKPPVGPALVHGSAVHAAVEHFLLKGTWPDEDTAPVATARRAGPVLEDWVALHGEARVEAEIRLDLAPWGGVDTLGGRVDWTGAHPRPWVLDHKTTASAAHRLGEEQIAKDDQLLAYAGALYPGVDVVVGHLYYPPPGTTPYLVEAIATVDAIDEVLRAYAASTVAIATHRAAVIPDAVPAATSARTCSAYGGCFHAAVCSAAPSYLKRQENNVSKVPALPPDTPAALTPSQIEARRRLGLPVPVSAAVRDPAPVVLEAPEPIPPTFPTGGILSPDFVDEGAAFTPPPAPSSVSTVAIEASTAPAPTKKSRKKTPPAAPAPSPTVGPDPDTTPSAIVLVGCVSSVGGMALEEWVPEILAAAAGTDGHYLLVNYAKGPLHVAAAVASALRAGSLTIPARLEIPADHPCAAAIVPVLRAAGAEIVRGVR